MRIYRLKEFLELPEGTVFCKGKPWIFEAPQIKGESLQNTGGFFSRQINWVDAHDSGEAFAHLDEMLESGASYPLETCEIRDGMHQKDAIFLVYEKADLEKLIEDFREAMIL